MEIRIHLPRPFLLLALIVVVFLFFTGVLQVHSLRGDTGGTGGQSKAEIITAAVQDIDRQQVRQAVLDRQEEILRYESSILEEQALKTQSADALRELRETRAALLSIIAQRTHSEELLRASLEELWEAEGTSYTLGNPAAEQLVFWPVQPTLGLSATFNDSSYKERFGFPHYAIDIPVPQGTRIQAPAPATVLKVAINGLGYSYIILDHGESMPGRDDDVQTVYGHITVAAVKEGDHIDAGQVIGETGGQPGTPGAGLLTTGPHLHFAMKVKGVLVDPLKYLPQTRIRGGED